MSMNAKFKNHWDKNAHKFFNFLVQKVNDLVVCCILLCTLKKGKCTIQRMKRPLIGHGYNFAF